MSVTGKRKSTIGVGHDGAPKPGAFVPFDHPRAMGSHPDATEWAKGAVEQTHVKADLGRAPKVKRALLTAPPIAGGMTAKSRRTGEHFHNVGGQDLSRYDADPGKNPLGGAPRGKALTPVTPVPGQRSRVGEVDNGEPGQHQARNKPDVTGMRALGEQIMREAFAVSGSDHPANLGVGSLPDSTNENS